MEHSDKVEVTPKTTTNFQKHTEKLTKLLKIILKLARINAYDYTGRIKNKDGSYIENSNLIQLLNHAMMGSRVLIGEAEFIRLLYEANVEPELLINDNVKVKLLKLYNEKKSNEEEYEPRIIEDTVPVKRAAKRKHDDDNIETIKRVRTEMPTLQPYNEIPINPPERMPVLSKHNYDDDNEEDQNINKRKRKRTWVFPEDDE